MARPRSDGQPARAPRRRHLTEFYIERLRPEAESVLVWDDDPKRLALAVQPSGHKTFVLVYPFRGKTRWYSIADAGDLPLAEARNIAYRLLGQVAQGIDVQYEKRKALVAARTEGTFDTAVTGYLAYARRKNKSWKQTEWMIRKYLSPRWGRLKVADIGRSEVKSLFNRTTTEGGPALGNAVLAAAGSVFTWLIKEQDAPLPAHPCHGITCNKLVARERHLSDSEIPLIWNALGSELDLMRGAALRTVLLTGARPGEVCHMRWEHLEFGKHRFTDANGRTFEAEGCWWTLPGEAQPQVEWPGVKSKRSCRYWLSPLAVSIIDEAAERSDKGFVFANSRGGCVSDLDSAMAKLCAKLGIEEPVRPHDLRRTCATLAAALGFDRDALDRLLNHVNTSVTGVYDRHHYGNESRAIAEAISGRVLALIGGEGEGSKVVALRG